MHLHRTPPRFAKPLSLQYFAFNLLCAECHRYAQEARQQDAGARISALLAAVHGGNTIKTSHREGEAVFSNGDTHFFCDEGISWWWRCRDSLAARMNCRAIRDMGGEGKSMISGAVERPPPRECTGKRGSRRERASEGVFRVGASAEREREKRKDKSKDRCC